MEPNTPLPSREQRYSWDIDWEADSSAHEFRLAPSSPASVDVAPPSGHGQADSPSSAELSSVWQIVREIIETIVLTVVIFLLIRIPTQTFRIEGFSMEPSFIPGQYLIVNKAVYWFREPSRGEVVVFRFSDNPPQDYIKRIIGLPGETVEVQNGQVYINGQPLEEPWPLKPGFYSDAPITLGPNEYYVLGDNRGNSSDSHAWGPLDGDRIIGKAWIAYWPPKVPTGLAERYPQLVVWFNKLKAALNLQHREPRYWGLIPTFPDPLKPQGQQGQQAQHPVPSPYP
ncbi:MAG: signal peptidase I [Ardenticatenia bacterium]|nr:signal peptidase I [Ardenticatenia bacterium]